MTAPHAPDPSSRYDVVVVGAGFCGLTAARALAKRGLRVAVVEADSAPGGLAGTFAFRDGVVVEKFYHHWFNNDVHVPELVRELGLEKDIVTMPSRTGMYFAGTLWRLSTPLDLLRFRPLALIDRIRLGLLVFQVRRVKDWKTIEHLSIREWLEPLCGKRVFDLVWDPLIRAKFGPFADRVNAVWFWKKLVLRGGTRDSKGGEQLAYFRGGFGRLANALATDIEHHGGRMLYDTRAVRAHVEGDTVTAIDTTQGRLEADHFVFTAAFPQVAALFERAGPDAWLRRMRRVEYLGNLCLVLELDRSLSKTYWINVNDPGFPFVGVIEHTNFDPPEHYAGRHIVFLSRYLATDDPLWRASDEAYLDFALEHLGKMFPDLKRDWVRDYRVWRAEYAQPVTERGYSTYVPGRATPYRNAVVSTMAQIYPEDRGTNYAIREGRLAAQDILDARG